MSEFTIEELNTSLGKVLDNVQEAIEQVNETTTSDSLQLRKMQQCFRLFLVSLCLETSTTQPVVNQSSLVVSQLRKKRSQLSTINTQIERKIEDRALIARNLATKIKFIESEAEVEQAETNLAITEIEIRIDELKKAVQIVEQLDSDRVKSPIERRNLIKQLNQLKGQQHIRDRNLLLELEKLEQQKFDLSCEAEIAEAVKTKKLLELNLEQQKINADREILEAAIAKNQADLEFNQAYQDELNASQKIIQAEIELNQALESGEHQLVSNLEESLNLARANHNMTQSKLSHTRQQVQLTQQSLHDAQKRLELQRQLAQNALEALELKQQATQAKREAANRARGKANRKVRDEDKIVTLSAVLV